MGGVSIFDGWMKWMVCDGECLEVEGREGKGRREEGGRKEGGRRRTSS